MAFLSAYYMAESVYREMKCAHDGKKRYVHVFHFFFKPPPQIVSAHVKKGMKQPGEAATMYELGGQEDRAAAIYVVGKDLDKAALVMPRVTLPKLLGQYAKACEITGRYGNWRRHERERGGVCRGGRTIHLLGFSRHSKRRARFVMHTRTHVGSDTPHECSLLSAKVADKWHTGSVVCYHCVLVVALRLFHRR